MSTTRRRRPRRNTRRRNFRRRLSRRRFNRPMPGGAQFSAESNVTITQGGNAVVPQSMNVKLRYFEQYTVTASDSGGWSFRANSLFDPLYATGGHQPMGFDQWSALYDSYRVNAVKIKQTYIANSTGQHLISDNPSTMIAIWPDYNQENAPMTKQRLMEQPQRAVSYASGTGGPQIASVEMYVPIHKFFGLTKEEYEGDSSYHANVSSNPGISALVYAQVGGLGTGGKIMDGICHYELTYYATFYEPKALASS